MKTPLILLLVIILFACNQSRSNEHRNNSHKIQQPIAISKKEVYSNSETNYSLKKNTLIKKTRGEQ